MHLSRLIQIFQQDQHLGQKNVPYLFFFEEIQLTPINAMAD
jgi:hypothetical protein